MLLVVGQGILVVKSLHSDLKVLNGMLVGINDTLVKLISRIFVLEIGGTGDIYIVSVVLLLWFCYFSFLFCLLLVFFWPTFEDILTSTRSFTLFLKIFNNVRQFWFVFCCCYCMRTYFVRFVSYKIDIAFVFTIWAEFNNIRSIWIWSWCNN